MHHRNHSVTLIRLIAALLVLSGHMSYIMGRSPTLLWGHAVQGLGVKIFFLLGGVLITKSWLSDPHPLRYAIKRFVRIWPSLAAFVVLAALVFGPMLSRLPAAEYYANPSLWAYFHNLRLYIVYVLPGVFETNPYPNAVNGSLWTLPVEVFMYLFIPVFCFLFQKIKNRRAGAAVCSGLCVAVLAASVGLSLAPGTRLVFYATDWVAAMEVLPFYFIGMVYTLFEEKLSKYLNLPVAILLMIGFSCFDFQAPLYTIFFTPAFAYLILSFSFVNPISFGGKWAENLEISYGIYLWGFFIQQTVEYLLLKWGLAVPFAAELLVCTALSALFGWLSMKFVEQPTQEISREILKRIPAKHEKGAAVR